MEKRCKLCEFFQEVKINGAGKKVKGFCWRYPPTVSNAVLQTYQGNRSPERLNSSSVRPVTDGEEFCGEFMRLTAPDHLPESHESMLQEAISQMRKISG
jgi:hypothetical protein